MHQSSPLSVLLKHRRLWRKARPIDWYHSWPLSSVAGQYLLYRLPLPSICVFLFMNQDAEYLGLPVPYPSNATQCKKRLLFTRCQELIWCSKYFSFFGLESFITFRVPMITTIKCTSQRQQNGLVSQIVPGWKNRLKEPISAHFTALSQALAIYVLT